MGQSLDCIVSESMSRNGNNRSIGSWEREWWVKRHWEVMLNIKSIACRTCNLLCSNIYTQYKALTTNCDTLKLTYSLIISLNSIHYKYQFFQSFTTFFLCLSLSNFNHFTVVLNSLFNHVYILNFSPLIC